jgi:putative transposase
MARQARFVVSHCAHHVVARGVNHCNIFGNDNDKERYKRRLNRLAEEEDVEIHAYAIMDNHVHLLLTPKEPAGLARLFQRLHTWWSQTYNKEKKRSGPLFEGRFRSSPVDETHFWAAMRYIELNRKRARPATELASWPHSSARAHLTGRPDPIVRLSTEAIARRRWGPAQWRQFLTDPNLDHESALKLSLLGSRPCGSAEWMASLAARN